MQSLPPSRNLLQTPDASIDSQWQTTSRRIWDCWRILSFTCRLSGWRFTAARKNSLRRCGSSYLPDHVFSAKRIRQAKCAFGIIVPLSIHEETVVMRAGRQFHRRPPNTFGAFFHADGVILPLREVAHQLHARRAGRGDGEDLFPANAATFRIDFLCHNFFLFQPHRQNSNRPEEQAPSRCVEIQASS